MQVKATYLPWIVSMRDAGRFRVIAGVDHAVVVGVVIGFRLRQALVDNHDFAVRLLLLLLSRKKLFFNWAPTNLLLLPSHSLLATNWRKSLRLFNKNVWLFSSSFQILVFVFFKCYLSIQLWQYFICFSLTFRTMFCEGKNKWQVCFSLFSTAQICFISHQK